MAESISAATSVPLVSGEMVVGYSHALREIYSLLPRVAAANSNVLIYGESGTGKELLARAVHYRSPRARGPFIKVCCAAMPDTLLESELFGHERGAFTDAVSRRLGRFELAHRGTILLDEVGEMSPAMQAKLLRVLQEGEFERLGGCETIKVDVRTISSTNRDLKEEVAKGCFRADLYFRLNVIPLILPPLRERKDDIPLLCERFIARFNGSLGRKVCAASQSALEMLVDYAWPGNIRELENCIERAMVLAQGEEIGPEQLCWLGTELKAGQAIPAHQEVQSPLEMAERREIERALKQAGWNRTRAAAALNLSRKTLYHKIKKYGLVPEGAARG
jgi:transcriptional regulator with GAF, ATPase, and Fis domain